MFGIPNEQDGRHNKPEESSTRSTKSACQYREDQANATVDFFPGRPLPLHEIKSQNDTENGGGGKIVGISDNPTRPKIAIDRVTLLPLTNHIREAKPYDPISARTVQRSRESVSTTEMLIKISRSEDV